MRLFQSRFNQASSFTRGVEVNLE
uniref:Uncharacterized protein n=1 Tax=Anguilla anguilla TaxID=7936 RepID=A0A0E9UG55_ANGAN